MWQFVLDELWLSMILHTVGLFKAASIFFTGACNNNLKADMNNNVLFVEQTLKLISLNVI